jgi:hypothetical protein
MIILNASICLDTIDHNRVTIAKNGKKYVNLSIIVTDQKDKYDNDVNISHSQSKEERDTKASKIFLGNGKKVFQN